MNKLPEPGAATARPAATWLAALIVLAACNGDGGAGHDANAPPAAPQPESPCDSTGAIEGGGWRKLAGVVSDVGTDGHVSVSNVRFAASGAKVFVDGASASLAKLGRGDVVSVTGSFDLDLRTGCAASIFSDADITAAIDSVDSPQQKLTMLGQQIRVDSDTVFGEGLQSLQLSSLQVGERIRVTGLYGEDGVIAAKRIDRAASQDGYFVAGVVHSLDGQNRTFRINALIVQYEGATLDGFVSGEPRNGDNVRVTGTTFGTSGSASPPLATTLEPARVEYIEYGAPLTIAPARIRIAENRSIFFTASSGSGTTTWSLSKGDGGACSPQACGGILASGEYRAPGTDRQLTILVTATSVADPEVSATAVVDVDPIPILHSGSHTVVGDVFSHETGMIADASFNIWIDLGAQVGGYSYVWANGPVTSDGAGHFEAPNVPDSKVQVLAFAAGHLQPCAVTVAVNQDISLQIEMVSVASLDTFNAPRPQFVATPTLSGQIYENTATGRQPVAGAGLWVEPFMDRGIATTMSDRGGGYFLCNLGHDDVFVHVSKDGFAGKWVGPLDPSQPGAVDIELERSVPGS
jgi:hypothetical protein